MKKDRFVAFFDAIMAIIMTIVVLEFVIPGGTSWNDLETLLFQIIAYAVTFFYLASMWINIHDIWHDIEIISGGILWTNIVMLFFSSMIPFFTVYLGRNLSEIVPALLYGGDILLVTLSNIVSIELLSANNSQIKSNINTYRKLLAIDILIKLIGLILGIFVAAEFVLISVFVAMIFLAVFRVKTIKR